MLENFLTANHHELISRCMAKAERRFAPSAPPAAINNGVPLFLRQLTQTLLHERLAPGNPELNPSQSLSDTAIGRTAATHGGDLLRQGFTIDQVVREYGDICQSVTQLALEQKAGITVEEFKTLNRCLDDAIADAVTSYARGGTIAMDKHADNLHARLDEYFREHKMLSDIANDALGAIRSGGLGMAGATGTLLAHTLEEMRSLVARTEAMIQRP